jgi:hypothetical protein
MESLGGPCALGLNLVSGVGIIILNKYIVARDGFDYMVVLSFCHLVFTCCFCQALVSLDYVSIRGKIKLQERLVLASVRRVHERCRYYLVLFLYLCENLH